MTQKIRTKEHLETNCYEESVKRTEYIFNQFDHICVSFSGGKDSTAVLNIALEVARKQNKLPLHVLFFDEECIHPTTIEYVERVRQSPDIKMDWYCLPFRHRNASSNEEPFWYTWDPDKKDLWVRDLPNDVITEHPKFRKEMSFQDFTQYLFPRSMGNVCCLTGIRTEESLRRYQVIARKKNDHFLNSHFEGKSSTKRAFPIYDWNSKDVWIAVHKFGWDYNTTYDIFNQTKLYNRFLTQRVCPPFGEEPLRGLWLYAECFPQLWHKMLNRVKGVATAWRYANSELYSHADKKPEHMTYKEYLQILIQGWDHDYKLMVMENINRYMRFHKKESTQPIPDVTEHPVSGVSYKFLCKVAQRGDFKGRQKNILRRNATNTREKLKITQQEAKLLYS